MKHYIVYTTGISKNFQREIYVIYGPAKEFDFFKNRSSLRSHKCSHLEEKYIGYGDKRYKGPKAQFAKVIAEAHEWATGQGMKEYEGSGKSWPYTNVQPRGKHG